MRMDMTASFVSGRAQCPAFPDHHGDCAAFAEMPPPYDLDALGYACAGSASDRDARATRWHSSARL
jgi:hypothetical protein